MLKGGGQYAPTKPSSETILAVSEYTSIRDMAAMYNVSTSTISRWRREARQKEADAVE